MQSSGCSSSLLFLSPSLHPFVLIHSFRFYSVFLSLLAFVSSFSISSFFIRRIGYVATSLMRRSFNYGVSVFRFDCRTYYSRCAHLLTPFAFFDGFFSSSFSRNVMRYHKSHFLVSYEVPRFQYNRNSNLFFVTSSFYMIPFDHRHAIIKFRALPLNVRDV